MNYKKYKKLTLIVSLLLSNAIYCSFLEHTNAEIKSANELYAQGKFVLASEIYKKVANDLLTNGQYCAEVYYNIGNCYYRENKLGYARYYYELAKLISPRDKDINFNLKFILQTLGYETSKNIFLQYYDMFKFEEINYVLFFVNIIFFVFLIIKMFYNEKNFKKISNILSVIFFILVVIYISKYKESLKTYAIVIEPTEIGSSPDENFYTKTSPITEGNKVLVLSEKENFYAIYLPQDNVQGWIKKDKIKIIKL